MTVLQLIVGIVLAVGGVIVLRWAWNTPQPLFVECAVDGRRKLMRIEAIAAADFDSDKNVLTIWFTTSPSTPFVMRGVEATTLGNYLRTRAEILTTS